MKSQPAVIVLCLLFICSGALGQNKPSPSGCSRLNMSAPSIYVSYERETSEMVNGKSVPTTILRVHNNTDCDIRVNATEQPDLDLYYAVTEKGKGSEIITRYVQKRIDGPLVDLSYDLRRSDNAAWAAGNYAENRDIVYIYDVAAGLSVTFPVRSEHLKKPAQISLSFSYRWETYPHGEMVGHRVFYYSDYPKGYYVSK